MMYLAVLAPIAFVLAYCGVQSVRDLRGRRYGFAVAGAICAALTLGAFVTEAYNVALNAGVAKPVRVVRQ